MAPAGDMVPNLALGSSGDLDKAGPVRPWSITSGLGHLAMQACSQRSMKTEMSGHRMRVNYVNRYRAAVRVAQHARCSALCTCTAEAPWPFALAIDGGLTMRCNDHFAFK